MAAQHDPLDEPFFTEWRTHRHLRRSKTRSTHYRNALGLTRTLPVPALVVVGSKGKGTAVAAAAWSLAKHGTVGTITSPPLRHNRERIRINGRAITPAQYADLSHLAHTTRTQLEPVTDGYLPPSGMYTLTGIAYLLACGVDYLVVEEGLGGLSDDVSLFDYPVVAATHIFMEHGDVLGNSIAEVVADLLGVVTLATRTVVIHSDQPPQVVDELGYLGAQANKHHGEGHYDSGLEVEVATGSTMTAANLEVGARAAWALVGQYLPVAEGELLLPARASVHESKALKDGTRWMVDAAINAHGVAQAVARAVDELGAFRVLACFPDVKDVDACMAELAGLPVTLVGAGADYLHYDELATYGEVREPAQAFAQAAATGANVLAVGTMSFCGAALEFLDAPVDFWW